jgi:hypothetical protein
MIYCSIQHKIGTRTILRGTVAFIVIAILIKRLIGSGTRGFSGALDLYSSPVVEYTINCRRRFNDDLQDAAPCRRRRWR